MSSAPPQLPPETEPFVDSEEVMRVLDISYRQFLRLLRDTDDRGEPQVPLPFHILDRMGRRKFLLSEVHAWRTTRRKETGS